MSSFWTGFEKSAGAAIKGEHPKWMLAAAQRAQKAISSTTAKGAKSVKNSRAVTK